MPRKAKETNNIKEIGNNTRRTKGDGSLHQRKDGTWCGQVIVGRKDDGKPVRKTVYGKTKREVAEKVRELARSVDINGLVAVSSLKDTIFEPLCRQWFDLYIAPNYADVTLEHRRAMLINHIFPVFGTMNVKKITTDQLQRFINDKQTVNVDGREGYSRDYVGKMKCMLNSFFIHAVERKYILVNPMAGVKLRRTRASDISAKSGKALNPEIRRDVFAAVMADVILKPIIITFTMTGLRPQELVALRWANVNIEQRTIGIVEAVNRTRQFDEAWNVIAKGDKVGDTKTLSSIRTLPMSEIVTDVLCEWKDYCQEKNIYSEYVFPNTRTGGRRKYSGLRSNLERFIKRHGFDGEGISLYTFRHTFATELLNRKENPRLVADLMGHVDASTTMKFYSSIFKETHIAAAKTIDATFADFTQNKNPSDLVTV